MALKKVQNFLVLPVSQLDPLEKEMKDHQERKDQGRKDPKEEKKGIGETEEVTKVTEETETKEVTEETETERTEEIRAMEKSRKRSY